MSKKQTNRNKNHLKQTTEWFDIKTVLRYENASILCSIWRAFKR